jgi:hypothetical protein
MEGARSDYTLVLAEEAYDGATVTDYIVTDGGVLFATADHGATWRWYGLVDPELFLLDLGFVEAWGPAGPETLARSFTGRRHLAA